MRLSPGRPAAGIASLTAALIRMVYPPQCLACGTLTGSDFGLCGPCWREMPFIAGPVCEACGQPVIAEADEAGALCESCHRDPPNWHSGRAAALYSGKARDLVLQLKHGDRMELARPMAQWLARVAAPLILPGTLVIPVPLHRWRLFRRHYNQAALLSAALAKRMGLEHCPDALIRIRPTGSQEGRLREARHAALAGALRASARQAHRIRGRPVLIVDDVMTSGATFRAATEACLAAGAERVSVLALARVAKEA